MERDQSYQQQAFDLTALHERDQSSAEAQTPAVSSQSERPTTRFHTLTSAGSRLPEDLWQEYRLEVEFREEHGMPHVSLEEFQDMRDFSDREQPQDVAWPAQPYTVYQRKENE